MTIPKMAMKFFVCYALGLLSTIYRRGVVEPFDIVGDTANATTRLASLSANFADVAGATAGMDKEIMYGHILKATEPRRSEIDEKEVRAMFEFTFHQVEKTMKRGSVRLAALDEFTEMHREVWELDDGRGSTHNIDIDHFSEAATADDKVRYRDVIRLFDEQRPRSRLEKLFTPRQLRKA